MRGRPLAPSRSSWSVLSLSLQPLNTCPQVLGGDGLPAPPHRPTTALNSLNLVTQSPSGSPIMTRFRTTECFTRNLESMQRGQQNQGDSVV